MSVLGTFRSVVRTSRSPSDAQLAIEAQEFGFLDHLLEAVLGPPLYKVRIDYEPEQVIIITRASKKSAIFLAFLSIFSCVVAAAPVAITLGNSQLSSESLALLMIVAPTLLVGLITLRILGGFKHDRFTRLATKALAATKQIP